MPCALGRLIVCVAALATFSNGQQQPGFISTVAGGGPRGGLPALSTNLPSPSATAISPVDGLTYVSSGVGAVYRLNANGTLDVVAGIPGSSGSSPDGILAVNAKLSGPFALAFDAAGNLYIAEYYGHRVRKVSVTTGILTTVAGSGAPGYSGDSGPATSATLDYPDGIAFDRAGNLYIADSGNYAIRKVTAASGLISTIAGNGVSGYSGDGGPARQAGFGSVDGLAVDSLGNVYVSDAAAFRVRKITAATGL